MRWTAPLSRLAGRPIAWGGLLVVVVLAVRVYVEGTSELSRVDALNGRASYEGISHARQAARAYWPGASHVARAYDALRTMARSLEREGRYEEALFAWRALRGAALSSRSFLVPAPREVDDASAAIARLVASGADPPTSFASRPPAVSPALLAAAPPSPRGTVLRLVALLGIFGLRARDKSGPGMGVRWNALFAAALIAVWTLSYFLP